MKVIYGRQQESPSFFHWQPPLSYSPLTCNYSPLHGPWYFPCQHQNDDCHWCLMPLPQVVLSMLLQWAPLRIHQVATRRGRAIDSIAMGRGRNIIAVAIGRGVPSMLSSQGGGALSMLLPWGGEAVSMQSQLAALSMPLPWGSLTAFATGSVGAVTTVSTTPT